MNDGETAHRIEAGDEEISPAELQDAWRLLTLADRVAGFRMLPREGQEEVFFGLTAAEQADLVSALPAGERRSWVRLLDPDDAADVIQASDPEKREAFLALLDEGTRKEVTALLAYEEDAAGGLMSPRFARVRPDVTVDEAIGYLRPQTRERAETIYYAYVLDNDQKLLGVVSFRQLFAAPGKARVRDIMATELVTIPETMDQERVSQIFSENAFLALPVVDADGRMKGIVTVDDSVEGVQEEATEDIQKLGGTAALEKPYLQGGILPMIRKRAGWLSALFLGEMLTATAMGYFEKEIARAVVLALFVPLIISSGGNSGSQATTLVIRAMALGEVRLGDWWRVVRRELAAGLGLGLILGCIGFCRIMVWERVFHTYGEHYRLVATTVGTSLVGVVLWGTLSGSMLPFLLRRLGFDPASASAPFVATLVDVSGLIIYFTAASVIMSGTLL